MTDDSVIPLLAVLVSLVAVPLVLVSSRSPRVRESWTIGAALVKFGLVLSLLPRVLDGRIPETRIGVCSNTLPSGGSMIATNGTGMLRPKQPPTIAKSCRSTRPSSFRSGSGACAAAGPARTKAAQTSAARASRARPGAADR